jgi:NTE family protein
LVTAVSHPVAALRCLFAAFALLTLAGCATNLPDVRLEKVDLASGYRLDTQMPASASKDPETLLMLAFSGGGTRAAAFSYGVLEELRRTTVNVKSEPRRLVDEIDAISSVSGGTFTALAFKLYGEALFDTYEDNFLKRNVQGALLGSLLNPINWPSLIFTGYGRSDLAAQYYDRILFNGATFRDITGKPGPLVIAGATDFSTGARFTFMQGTFDLICSNLADFRLSLAATASSAVPIVFDPVTLRNWGGTCGLVVPDWLKPALANNVDSLLLSLRVDSMLQMQDSTERPFVHLVDGGVSDNLGLRSLIDLLQVLRVEPSMRERLGLARVKRVGLIVVNSLSATPPDWGRSRAGPGIIATVLQSASVPIDHNSTDALVMMQWMLQRWKLEAELQRLDPALVNGAPPPDMEFYPIILSFDALGDPQARDFFNSLPTTLSLPSETVDRLREAGAKLLRDSAQFQRFLKSFSPPTAPRRAAAD